MKSLLGIRATMNTVKVIVVTVIVLAFVFVAVTLWYSTTEIRKYKSSIYVMDRTGKVTAATLQEISPRVRGYEYEAFIKMFYRTWYAFDENSYADNIKEGLNVLGQCRNKLLDSYEEQEIYIKIVENSLVLTVQVDSIKLGKDQNPVKGIIYGKQYVNRGEYISKRHLNCYFEINDVERSRDNPHGAKIEDWQIINNEIIRNE
jgi:hypothetical protein